MQAHASDLRAEVEKQWDTLCTTPRPDAQGCDDLVHQVVDDWRAAPLRSDVRQLVEFAEKLTRTPSACAEADVAGLRSAGWSDGAIHDAGQVVAYFNYINRIADALGVEPEEGVPRWGRRPVRAADR